MNKLLASGLLAALILLGCGQPDRSTEVATPAAVEPINLTVYQSPTCGCCKEWVEHVEERGFNAHNEYPQNLWGLKRELGLQDQYASCHTAVSESGYVFEGHIPAHLIHQFLQAPPEDALGLAVPGMPMGSPGMERGDHLEAYDVLLLKRTGEHEVYAHIDSPQQQYN